MNDEFLHFSVKFTRKKEAEILSTRAKRKLSAKTKTLNYSKTKTSDYLMNKNMIV